MKKILFLCVLSLFAVVSYAQDYSTAAGLWQTYEGGKPSGKPTGHVKIYEENGIWYGKIAGSSDPEDKDPSYCTKCPGEFKDQPVNGLRFMWGFTRNGNSYTGGNILDPNTGSIYNASMTLVDNGEVLKMRGYLGISLFGSTETWTRIKEPPKPKTVEQKAEAGVKKSQIELKQAEEELKEKLNKTGDKLKTEDKP